MTRKRVVVTGLGMLSPVGGNVTSSWNNIIEGSCGVKEIDKFDTSDFETKFAATVDINPEDYIKILPLNSTNMATKTDDQFNKVSESYFKKSLLFLKEL